MRTSTALRATIVAITGAVLSTVLAGTAPHGLADSQVLPGISRSTAAKATCGPNAAPEPGLQGDVPAADRDNGRSTEGYHCNISRIGQFDGHGGGVVSGAFDSCVYIGSFFPGSLSGPAVGVQVLDVSDPTRPELAGALTEPAMLAGTWETLKVHPDRKLLAAAGAPFLTGAGLLSIYDLTDCRNPRLLNTGAGSDVSQPLPITAHEAGFSPDGNTLWTSGTAPGLVSAVDITDPARPHVIWQGLPGLSMHGMGFNDDGTRLYLTNNMGGMTVLDTTAVQNRAPEPVVPIVSETTWTDGWATQHAIPVRFGDTPYLFVPDEAGSGGVKIIDVSDDRRPRIANSIKLEINLPENLDTALASSMGGSIFAYDPHYCSADRAQDPTALACAWFGSGIRVFDVRDPFEVKEIAYYNPPARKNDNADLTNSPHKLISVVGAPILSAGSIMQALNSGDFDPGDALSSRSGQLVNGDLSTDWCSSPPHWHGRQLWVSCNDNTYSTLELDAAVYTPPADQRTTIGS
ncbi:LVIVD repeat-containing protein [Nocardia sp. NPDC003693]